MRNTLLCTVGTSLLGNITRCDNADLKKNLTARNAKGLALALLRLAPNDRTCGAEINSVAAIVDKRLLSDSQTITLLVSDTDDGRFVGEILKLYYTDQKNPFVFSEASVNVVEGLEDGRVHRFRTEGLRNLVRLMAQAVRKHDAAQVMINATGGYKAQISFAGMIGQALDIPVAYLFERFSEIIVLPPQPISLSMDLWLEQADIFLEYEQDDTVSVEQVDGLPAARDERLTTLFEVVKDEGSWLVSLSPMGQLFHETFNQLFERQRQGILPPVWDVPHEKKKVRFEDDNRGKHKGLENYLGRIREQPYVKEIYTHYYNPRLIKQNCFRRSAQGLQGQVEGWYSNAGAITKFDVITTAKNSRELGAVIVDLSRTILSGEV